ncbi:radical SAM family heme chaperone HemW [Alkalicoccus luteus]|uniref:Heme chaperone HemW n=1 Tax=Alkalicoccus luteus TaxID=1237094 RepID=A0A969PLQ7_9BACI|nr:radical SAM family heme chaperone HemW [Alkalicoccus luteus]NJP36507.1 oxygen-independent coproporphyrinogen III oxidase [Alkalicoccus luteus]
MKNPSSLYVHVPFCEQICHYCDFNKFFLKNQPVADYIEACGSEMRMSESVAPIETVYIGGGTPTALEDEQLERLLELIHKHFTIKPSAEFTVEVNPGSASKETFTMMKRYGVNRLSIGAQTFDTGLLKAINRDHGEGDVEASIQLARHAGITDISVDMMFGLPGQTMEQWQQSLIKLVSLPISHVSAYSLKIEPKTVFYQMWNRGALKLPNQDMEAEMYDWLYEYLHENDFQAYEISNFAKPGYESLHNQAYWNNDGYVGIGAGAHGYVNGVRHRNHGPLPKYLKAIEAGEMPWIESHQVPVNEQMEEEMFMGLRKRIGVNGHRFEKRYGLTVEDAFPGTVSKLQERGLLQKEENHYRLTRQGLLLGNEVFEAFLLP